MDPQRSKGSADGDRTYYARDHAQADPYARGDARYQRPRSRSPGYRRRSRTPPRWETENWRGRPRSPVNRFETRDAHFRNDRPASPRRNHPPVDAHYETSSRGPRPRSPLKRGRDYSPVPARRTPPPPKRERYQSPRREYERPRSPQPYSPHRNGRHSPPPPYREHRARSRSPRRDERPDAYSSANWRRRSPSPRAERVSGANSRRSSPRLRYPEPLPEQVAYDAPARHERSYGSNGHGFDDERQRDRIMQEADPHPESIGSAPPTGPAASYSSASARAMYTGRGRGPAPPRDYPREYAGPSAAPRGPPHGAPHYPRAPMPRDASYRSREPFPPDAKGPPRRRDGQDVAYGAPFRGSNNSTSTTYPRTQRFDQHLKSLPSAKQGGEQRPDLVDMTKAEKLEEEAARLRKLIDEKEAKKRQGLREWDKFGREANTAQLKSDLTETHLRQLNGEGEGLGSAF